MQRCIGDCFYFCPSCWPKASEISSDVDFNRIVEAKFPVSIADTKEHVKHNYGQRSIYELTLTTSKDDPKALCIAMTKIVKSKMVGSIRCKYSIELTKSGLPHIHAIIYSSKKFIDASKIKPFWQERYELKKVISEEHYLNYILKEKNNPAIIAYCAKHNLKQFQECPLPVELPADLATSISAPNQENPLLQENL